MNHTNLVSSVGPCHECPKNIHGIHGTDALFLMSHKKVRQMAKTAEKKEEKKIMRYRCEVCGKLSDKPGKCCDEDMADLLSHRCMGCQGCGMH